MQQLTTQELKEKINSQENFIVDFYADWCGPCKVMIRNLEKVQESISLNQDVNNPNIYKFNIDMDKEFSMNEMGIRSIPTIKFFNNGEEYFSKTGIMQTSEIINLITNKKDG